MSIRPVAGSMNGAVGGVKQEPLKPLQTPTFVPNPTEHGSDSKRGDLLFSGDLRRTELSFNAVQGARRVRPSAPGLTTADRQALARLEDEAIRLAKKGESERAAAAFKAGKGLMQAIEALPPGQPRPVGLTVALNAIDQIGRKDYRENGEVWAKSNGITVRYGSKSDKCNALVGFTHAVGPNGGVGFGGKQGYPVNKDQNGEWWFPMANDLANPNARNTGNLVVVTGSPQIGDIVAWPSNGSVGHSAIYIGEGAVVYAGTPAADDPVKVNTLEGVRGSGVSGWLGGWLSGLGEPTFRRLK